MPVDVLTLTKDGEQILYHIPLRMMRGEKTNEMLLKPCIMRSLPILWKTSGFLFLPVRKITYPFISVLMICFKQMMRSPESTIVENLA